MDYVWNEMPVLRVGILLRCWDSCCWTAVRGIEDKASRILKMMGGHPLDSDGGVGRLFILSGLWQQLIPCMLGW